MKLSQKEVILQFPVAFNALPLIYKHLLHINFKFEMGNLYAARESAHEEYVWRPDSNTWYIVSHWAKFD